jgi:hypothetical protein
MTLNEEQLLIVKGMISEFSKEDQDKVNAIANKIRELAEDNGSPYGLIALALVGLEKQRE